MRIEDKINVLRKGIKKAEKDKHWSLVDSMYNELNTLTDRDAISIRQHACAVANSGDPARAATMLRKSLRLSSKDPTTKLHLGRMYQSQNRYQEAELLFREVLKSDPKNISAIIFLVQTIERNDQSGKLNQVWSKKGMTEAISLIKTGLKIDNRNGDLWYQLASILGNDRQKHKETVEAFEMALKYLPTSASTLNNYGRFKRLNADLAGAKKLLHKAYELEPKNSDFAFSLALCYLSMEDLKNTLKWLNISIKINPENNAAEVYKAFVLLIQGKFREGWKQYEKRLLMDEFKGLSYGRPRWTGDEIKGKILLLLSEQGIGDSIQFVRYASKIKELGGKVVIFTDENLKTLFQSVSGVSVVTSSLPLPKSFSSYSPLMSLPHIFKTTKTSIPDKTPYITAPSDSVNSWRKRIENYSGYKVGLVWRGNPKFAGDRFRSSSLQEMSTLLSISGTQFFSLMVEKSEYDKKLPKKIIDIGKDFKDFSDTAGAILALDLIITVDTAVCHLAGALGQSVWTMLPRSCDFRWGYKGSKTSWYPTMRLYRQKTLGDWGHVYNSMTKDLSRLITSIPPSSTR